MANLAKLLEAVIPKSPRYVGTVTTHNGDGTSNVELPAGGVLRVRGQAVAVGEKAFVQDGKIDGAAPDLPVVDIEI
jgi:hypothetical protein